jgi:glycerol-3-phosphate acyltransferase PlsX
LNNKTISIDAMGGDFGPSVTVLAGLDILNRYPDLHIIFVGLQEKVLPLLKIHGKNLSDRYSFVHASEVVAMDEPPAQALRSKKDSSMRVAINLVKEGKAQACVSAGNTGALMATARFVLKTLPGVDRPAIITRFPSQTSKEVRMLDLGANINSTAEQLFQFAVMGSIFASAEDNSVRPTVGLLNVGEEDIKGTPEIKRAAELLSNCPFVNYVGYVEGNALFAGVVDVIVCDGFVGNVALKACEGLAQLVKVRTKEAFEKNWITRLSALPAVPVLKKLMKRIDPRRRNGATLLGLNGIVVKSHGGADRIAYSFAIEEAILGVSKNVSEQIRQQLQAVLGDTHKE